MQEADRSRAQRLRLNRIVRVGGYENDWYVKAQMCAVSAPGNRPLKYLRTCDLDHAARPRNDSESKAMQLHNRGHQIQAKTQA
jgi:hypothetical protein